jgi:hypothetical protein
MEYSTKRYLSRGARKRTQKIAAKNILDGRQTVLLGTVCTNYELQFDLLRDVGLDYAPRQLFRFKIKPLT